MHRDGMRTGNVPGARATKNIEGCGGGKPHGYSPRTSMHAPVSAGFAFGFDVAASRMHRKRAVHALDVDIARAGPNPHWSPARKAQANVTAPRAALHASTKVFSADRAASRFGEDVALNGFEQYRSRARTAARSALDVRNLHV